MSLKAKSKYNFAGAALPSDFTNLINPLRLHKLHVRPEGPSGGHSIGLCLQQEI